jgi:hypothetical protein
MAEQVIQFHPSRPRNRLEKIGLFLRRNRRLIIGIQWLIVILYAAMVIIPAFLPLPPEDAHIWDNLPLFAQFCFWGLWWPGVMVATVTMGRVWCGLLCPEGARSPNGSASTACGKRPAPLAQSGRGWPLHRFSCRHHRLRPTRQRLRIPAGRPAGPRRIDRRRRSASACSTAVRSAPGAATSAPPRASSPCSPRSPRCTTKTDRAAWDRHQGDFEAGQLRPAARRPAHDQRLRLP